ncbi:phage integrase family protein [Noviherbaspirillum soli]|uniref:phage integrase family protein n=1 Tax=Noviherbaspirillum soli TaxID=1064518 RepID=UPI00188BF2B9|nr:phage integrase family protein [Noviherbaspirillum soli]
MAASWTSRGSVLIRLARQHFAFYRGYLDELDLRLLAERYPGGEAGASEKDSGMPAAKGLLGWITQQLVVEAERCGQRSAARLLRLRPVRKAAEEQAGALLTLAEFQEERDPYHMYSEVELLELFELEYPGRKGNAERLAQRNRRLRRRQEALLQIIEGRIRMEPSLDDSVSAWIDPRLANYLVKANIITLGQLHATIEAHGFHWYRKVPRIGVKAARHISSWLLLPSTRDALGATLSTRGITPPRKIQNELAGPVAKGLDILPLERLYLPDSLSGVTGTNRGAMASIAATNDIEAIQAWLLQLKPGSHTARACRKEAERFLLWAVLEAGKPLSSTDTAGVRAYLHFLSQLGRQSPEAWAPEHRIPQASWLGPRGVDRWSVRWRPFEGPLSIASQRAALSLLKCLMRFLHAAGYLQSDPSAGTNIVANPASKSHREESRRKAVLQDEWTAAWTYLESQPVSAQSLRIKAILLLLKETGCRLQRVSSLRRDALYHDGSQWRLRVDTEDLLGKTIIVSAALHDALLGIFRFHGFEGLDSVSPSAPLITAISTEGGSNAGLHALSGSRIYRIIKDYFGRVANDISATNPGLANRLRQISVDSFIYRE